MPCAKAGIVIATRSLIAPAFQGSIAEIRLEAGVAISQRTLGYVLPVFGSLGYGEAAACTAAAAYAHPLLTLSG